MPNHTLEQVMENPVLKQAFRQFLVKERSVENLEFLEDCERLKRISLQGKIFQIAANMVFQIAANTVCKKYKLEDNENMTVNLSDGTRKDCATKPYSITKFKTAKQEIVEMLRNDSFTRFINDTLYKGAAEAVKAAEAAKAVADSNSPKKQTLQTAYQRFKEGMSQSKVIKVRDAIREKIMNKIKP